MQATAFNEENDVLEPPSGMREGEDCDSLSVYRNGKVVVSCWKITPEEKEEMQRTDRVWLVIWGVSMPPAMVLGTSPFGTPNDSSE